MVLFAAAAGGVLARTVYRADPPPAEPPPANPEQPTGLLDSTPGATAHPRYETVRDLLETHFIAINERDYSAWKSTVVSAKSEEMPLYEWESEYSSTYDRDVLLHRVESGAGETLRVQVSFTSHQDPRDAPPQLPEPCVRWRVMYTLVPERGELRMDTSVPGSALVGRC